jgi:hypothetical protein
MSLLRRRLMSPCMPDSNRSIFRRTCFLIFGANESKSLNALRPYSIRNRRSAIAFYPLGTACLLLAKFQHAVFCIYVDGLAFADFAFEDVDAQRIENFLLNGAPERTRTVNGIVTFAREKFLG